LDSPVAPRSRWMPIPPSPPWPRPAPGPPRGLAVRRSRSRPLAKCPRCACVGPGGEAAQIVFGDPLSHSNSHQILRHDHFLAPAPPKHRRRPELLQDSVRTMREPCSCRPRAPLPDAPARRRRHAHAPNPGIDCVGPGVPPWRCCLVAGIGRISKGRQILAGGFRKAAARGRAAPRP